MNEQVKDANEKKKSKAGQFFEDMSKLTPAYVRYEASLSSYILDKVMSHCTKTIFERKREYMDKYNMNRRVFIKVFNLYCSLSFISILRKLKKPNKKEKTKRVKKNPTTAPPEQ